MAGVKGRSGGARPGAGRKKKPATVLAPAPAAKKAPAKAKAPAAPAPTPAPAAPPALAGIGDEGFDPRPALEQIAMGLLEVSAQQLKALTALLPYVHTKKGEGGKKDEQANRARKAGAGKFGASAPPLRLVGGK